MQAKDIMTSKVISISPDQSVRDIARLFVSHRISAVPVVDEAGRLMGIVSEGDLINRADAGTQHRGSWWLEFLASSDDRADAYVHAHGRRASDVMTRDVVTVGETTPLGEIAALLEKCRIKRVPVLRDGRIVGIVSRANLLHGLVAQKVQADAARSSESDIRAAIAKQLDEAGIGAYQVNVIVAERGVQLWGWVDSEVQVRAVQAAAEAGAGVLPIENHVTVMPAQVKAAYAGY